MKKKILMSALTLILTLCSAFAVNAENEFPPKRPEVGNMKISAFYERVAGLRTNGTINASGNSEFSAKDKAMGVKDIYDLMPGMNDIVDVSACGTIVALKSDGTLVVPNRHNIFIDNWDADVYVEARSWTDIAAIFQSQHHLVGLKTDGTLVAVGYNNNGQCNITGLSDISTVYVNDEATVALSRFGKLYPVGNVKNNNELKALENVKKLCMDFKTGMYFDGTVFPKLKNCINIDESDIFSTKYDTEEITLNECLKKYGYDINIKDVEVLKTDRSDNKEYLILDDNNTIYECIFEYLSPAENHISKAILTEKVKNVHSFCVNDYSSYYVLDNNGQIYSFGDDAVSFSTPDWILTTNITYDGKKINSDVAPYVKNDRTLAPIRAILEALGMEVEWDGETKTAIAVKGDISIKITIDSNIAIVNGKEQTLDVPAEVTQNRTFVPVRFFAEALNLIVDWNGNSKTVIIKSK